MAPFRLIRNGFWRPNSQRDIVFSREYNGSIRFSYRHLVLPLSVKEHWCTDGNIYSAGVLP